MSSRARLEAFSNALLHSLPSLVIQLGRVALPAKGVGARLDRRIVVIVDGPFHVVRDSLLALILLLELLVVRRQVLDLSTHRAAKAAAICRIPSVLETLGNKIDTCTNNTLLKIHDLAETMPQYLL